MPNAPHSSESGPGWIQLKKNHNKGVEEDSYTLIMAISFISAKEQKCWLKGNSFMGNAHEKKTCIITLGVAPP